MREHFLSLFVGISRLKLLSLGMSTATKSRSAVAVVGECDVHINLLQLPTRLFHNHVLLDGRESREVDSYKEIPLLLYL